MNRRWIRIAALVLTMVFVLGALTPAAAAKKKSKTSITVTTQEELVKALKSGKYKKITIKTDAKISFTLAAKYSNEDLKIVVDARNATFNCKGTVGSIVVNDAKTVKEYASGNNITINDEKLTFKIMEGASTEKVKIASESGEIKIVNNGDVGRFDVTGESNVTVEQNGSVGRLYVAAAGCISVSGTADEKLAVTVKPDAAGAQITSSLPVKANLYSDAEFVLKEGAEKSRLTQKQETVGVKLDNNTGKSVTVSGPNGEAINVRKGESFDNRKAAGSEDSSGTDEPSGTEETGSDNEPEPGAPEDLTDDPVDNGGGDEDPETAMRVEVMTSEVLVNGQSVSDGQVAGVAEDGTVVLLSADETLNELQKELTELFSDNSLASFLGPDGAVQNLSGTKLEKLILVLAQYNFAGFAFNIGGTATVVALSPMDLRVSGNLNTLLVGPDAPGINVIQERGEIVNMLVLDPDSNLFLSGDVQNLYTADTATSDTLHTHTPAKKTVNVVEPTLTEGGQYTIVTYCSDPACGMELDSKTYYTDKLTPPETEPEPDPCANGHTGGTATCKNQAICTVCNQPYGALAAHVPGSKEYSEEATVDGRPYTIHCSICGETLEEGLEPLPEPDPEEKTDPCANGHTGGTATCKNQAICTVCNQPYGALAAHVPGNKEYSEEATADGRPYTIHCSVCGETLEEGLEPLPDPEPDPEPEQKPETDPCANGHTGGTATCKNQAVCTVCNQPYGSLAAHSSGSKEYAEAATDGRPYTIHCSVCGETLETGLDPLPKPEPDAQPEVDPCANGHTGGTATCKDQAVCTVCNQPYGSLAAHSPGNKEYAEATAEGRPYTIHCSVCGETLETGLDPLPKPEPDAQPEVDPCANGHTGGSATCKDQAVCTVCNQPYGALAAHSPGNKEYAEATADGRPYTIHCSVCGETLETGLDPLPKPEPDADPCANGHTGGKADCLNQAVCTVCGKPYGEFGEHVFGEKEYTFISNDGKDYVIHCTVCLEQVDEGRDPPDE